MDHATAPCITRAQTWRAHHGIFGYTEPDGAYDAALTSWFSHRRCGWDIDPAWNTVTSGVVPALAVCALSSPGDAVVEKPVYCPFREMVEDNGRTVAAVPLMRDADGGYRRLRAHLHAAAPDRRDRARTRPRGRPPRRPRRRGRYLPGRRYRAALRVARGRLDADDRTLAELGDRGRAGVGEGGSHAGDDLVDEVLHTRPLGVEVHA